jgi:predicted TIM-barrel fold metal-dependent hydrolase
MDFKQTPEEVLGVMDQYEIDKSFIIPFPNMKPSVVNRIVSEAVKENPDRFVGFACVNPAADECFQVVEEAVSLGLKGIMLDPEFHRVWGIRSNVEELMVPCMEHNLVVLFNTPNIETGEAEHMGRTPYFDGVNALASKFPMVRIVVNTFWPRVDHLLRSYSNIYVDSGGRNGVSSAVNLATSIAPTRVCFGSESPQNHPAIGLKDVRTRKAPARYKDLMLGKNAERIFKDLL